MLRRLAHLSVAVCAAAGCLVGVTLPATAVAPVATASVPTDGPELLTWMAAHRDDVALAVSDGSTPIAVHATRRVPLASVYKVLLLVAYAERATAHRLDPAQRIRVTAVERWYRPGTDGGAHEQALAYWRSAAALQGSGTAATVSLDDVVTGMIRFSDDSAADYVLQRVGVAAAADVARRHGMVAQDPVQQKFGEYVAVSTIPARQWRALSPAQRSAESLALARATTAAAAARLRFPSAAKQGAFFEHGDTQGTAQDWLRLWSDIETGRGIAPDADAIVRRHAEWQQEIPVIADAFAHDGFKGGSYTTVLNLTGYEITHDGRTVHYALFLHDLPPAVAGALTEPAIDFVQRLALEPAFYRSAVETLTT